MSIRLVVAGIIGCLMVPLATTAQQQPRSPVRLAVTTRAPAAKPALETALLEFTNSEFVRSDARFLSLLQAEPDAGIVRALYAASSPNLAPAERLRELDRAVADAAKASTPELVLAAAMREWRAGRSQAALALLDAAHRLLPDESLVPVLQIGMAANDEERLRLAEAGAARYPDCPGIQNYLAYAQFRSGFRKEGLATAQRYVQMLPDHFNPHDTYAELLHWSGDLDAAEAEYRRAAEIEPAAVDVRFGLAEVALSRGDYQGARTHAEAALAHAREPVEIITILYRNAWAAALTRDTEATRRYFARAIAAADAAGVPARVRTLHVDHAVAEAVLGHEREARAALDAALALTPANPWDGFYRHFVAAVLKDRADMQRGLAEFEKAAATGGSPTLQEGMHLARAIDAAVNGQLDLARAELASVKQPAWRVAAQGFLARALREQRDTGGLQQLRRQMEEYTSFDGQRAAALALAR